MKKINDNTYLIDVYFHDIGGLESIYLITDERNCLIDSGSKDGGKNLIKWFEQNNLVPDMIILTHSHWDHSQGVPVIRNWMKKQNKKIEVYASNKALPYLKDQSYNSVFKNVDQENIDGVIGLKHGDIIDLGTIKLEIYDAPGHHDDHIAIFDQKNRNLFVGDSIGIKIGENASFPPFMPPFWNEKKYYDTINMYKNIDYTSISLAHYGSISGEQAKKILDDSVQVYLDYWKLFKENEILLDNPKKLTNLILERKMFSPPYLKSNKRIINVGLAFFRNQVNKYLLRTFVEFLITGYKISCKME